MSIPVSTIPAVTAYLLTAIQNVAAPDPLVNQTLIRVGQPAQGIPPDVIVIGAAHRTVDPMAFVGSGGQFALQEIYDLDVTVQSFRGNGDSTADSTQSLAVLDRVWELVSYVETAVRNDPSLGDLVDLAYPKESTTEGPVWSGEPIGVLALVTVPIHVESTL